MRSFKIRGMYILRVERIISFPDIFCFDGVHDVLLVKEDANSARARLHSEGFSCKDLLCDILEAILC